MGLMVGMVRVVEGLVRVCVWMVDVLFLFDDDVLFVEWFEIDKFNVGNKVSKLVILELE